jgi:hypothetical protein
MSLSCVSYTAFRHFLLKKMCGNAVIDAKGGFFAKSGARHNPAPVCVHDRSDWAGVVRGASMKKWFIRMHE